MSHTITAYRVFVASPGGLGLRTPGVPRCNHRLQRNGCNPARCNVHPGGMGANAPRDGTPAEAYQRRSCRLRLLCVDSLGSIGDLLLGDEAYTSATSEEYSIARECWKDPNHCLREIAAFFKAPDPRQMSDPGDQLRKVLDFKRQLERTKELLFRTFDDVSSFQRDLQGLLAKWIRAHEQGEKGSTIKLAPGEPSIEPPPAGLLPTASVTAGLTHLDRSREVLEEAERLAAQGRLTDAEMLFARAMAKDNEPGTALQYARFLRRLGRFSQAQAMLEGILERPTAAGEEHWKAGAY